MDEYNVHKMDIYGALLLTQKGRGLQELADRVMKSNPQSPECWIILSLYFQKKGLLEKALKYADKAIEINPRHVFGLIIRGTLLTALNKLDEAILTFKQAHMISSDIIIYEGLVRCYILIPKYKEALHMAKQAFKLYENCAKSYILLGMVYATQVGGRERATKYFNKAIEISTKENNHEGVEEGVLGLVDIAVKQQRYSHAIQLLKQQLEKQKKDT